MSFDCYITPYALTKIDHYAAEAQPSEIGGFAQIEEKDDGTVIVTDFHPIEQEATAAHFDIKPEDVNKFSVKMLKDGREGDLEKCSALCHSHPEGMSAHMSGPDVDAIKRNAMEEESFSLIYSASAKPGDAEKKCGTDKLLMHWCGNIRGRKVIIRDMKVQMAYMVEREKVGEQIAAALVKNYSLSGSDQERVQRLAREFAINTLPGLWAAEVAAIAEEAKTEVAKLIKTQSYGFGFNRDVVVKRTNDYHDHGWYGHGWYGHDYDSHWDKRLKEIDTEKDARAAKHMHMTSIANGWDPDSNEKVSKNAQKRAQKWLDKQKSKTLKQQPEQTMRATNPIQSAGDWVLVSDDAINDVLEEHGDNMNEMEMNMLMELAMKPSKIQLWKTNHATGANMAQVGGLWFDPMDLEVVDMDVDDNDYLLPAIQNEAAQ